MKDYPATCPICRKDWTKRSIFLSVRDYIGNRLALTCGDHTPAQKREFFYGSNKEGR